MQEYGLIFDMDNTILDTHIDFAEMHSVTATAITDICRRDLLIPVVDFEQMATAQMINWAKANGFSQEQIALLWNNVAEVEARGMRMVEIEKNAPLILKILHDTGFFMSVLTNNSLKAARLAMENSDLAKFFHEIHARDEYNELKPSPKGILSIMGDHPQVKKWVMLGDSWLDGQAAKLAGISFIAYGKQSASYWQKYDIAPDIFLPAWQNDILDSVKSVLK